MERLEKGKFSKWMPIEGMNYLFVVKDDRIENGKHISDSWFISENLIKLIYPL